MLLFFACGYKRQEKHICKHAKELLTFAYVRLSKDEKRHEKKIPKFIIPVEP